jgi:SAM-dependent methyltransferase
MHAESLFKRFVSSGTLLDLGCGSGMFLKTAREQGFSVHGIEMSKDAARVGREQWKLDIEQGNLYELPLGQNAYDVITLWHVFEHLHDPETASRLIYRATKPGGILVIAVPNWQSWQAHLFRDHWFHLDVPRHLFHYTPVSLSKLLGTAGFAVVDVCYQSREHNWAGILGSLMRLSPPGESLIHKFARKSIGMPLSRCAAFMEASAARGGTFEIYARKPGSPASSPNASQHPGVA